MDSTEFFEKIRSHPRPVIVDLWAPWCAPCRVISPLLQQVAEKYEGRVDLWKINTDKSPEVAVELQVMGIPTIIGFAGGEEIVRKTGMQQPEMIELLFELTLKQQKTPILPPTRTARVLRSGVGLLLIGLGIFQSWMLLPIAVGGVLVFSAFYDRCPVFGAFAPSVLAWLRKHQIPVG